MELRDLEQFLAVLEHGSILGAAEANGLAQPALSRRMRALEESLGVPLLNRSARGVKPTVYGDLLARHARLLLRDSERAAEELRDLRDGVVGHARVGVAPAFAGILPSAIQQLADEHKGLSFGLTQGTYDTLVHSLRAGDIDGAFTLLAPGESAEGLAVDTIIEVPVRVVCGFEHPLRRKRKVRLADLAKERWVIMNRPRSIAETFRAFASASGLEIPRVAVETDSLDLVKSLVLGGGFLAPLPATAMSMELRDKRAAALALEGLPTLPAGFIHRQEVLPPPVALLLEAVREQLRHER